MKGAAAARETSVPRSGVDLVARLLQRCVLEASSVIPTGSRLALLGFPNHADPGAASTWLGELELAKRIRATVVYAAHHESYRADTLLASEPDFVVLHGGGNSIGAPPDFSCLLRGLSGIPVVQLSSRYPWEPGGEALERLAESVERHGNVTIFAGCGQSFASLNWALPAGACRMAPDSALLCSIPPARGAPLREVIWLSRRDGESVRRERVPTRRGLLRADWEVDDAWAVLTRRLFGKLGRTFDSVLLDRIERAFFVHMASSRMRRGIRLLRSGEVGITDRLHAHVLFLLCGIPHILLDDRSGRLRSFYDTWTRDWSGCRFAADEEEALGLAHYMREEHGFPSRSSLLCRRTRHVR